VTSAAGTPTGNVTVTDGVDSCTATVSTGLCNIILTTPGNRTLTATYIGDVNFNGSSATTSHTTLLKTVTIPAATGNGDITLSTDSPGCGFASYSAKTEAQVGNDASYDYPYGLVEFTLNCAAADVTITFPGSIGGSTYRKYGPTTPGNAATTAWYTFNNVTLNGSNSITLHLADGQLGDDTGVDGIIVDQGGPGLPPGGVVAVPTMTEWGMILFMLCAGLGAVYLIKRRRA